MEVTVAPQASLNFLLNASNEEVNRVIRSLNLSQLLNVCRQLGVSCPEEQSIAQVQRFISRQILKRRFLQRVSRLKQRSRSELLQQARQLCDEYNRSLQAREPMTQLNRYRLPLEELAAALGVPTEGRKPSVVCEDIAQLPEVEETRCAATSVCAPEANWRNSIRPLPLVKPSVEPTSVRYSDAQSATEVVWTCPCMWLSLPLALSEAISGLSEYSFSGQYVMDGITAEGITGSELVAYILEMYQQPFSKDDLESIRNSLENNLEAVSSGRSPRNATLGELFGEMIETSPFRDQLDAEGIPLEESWDYFLELYSQLPRYSLLPKRTHLLAAALSNEFDNGTSFGVVVYVNPHGAYIPRSEIYVNATDIYQLLSTGETTL